MERRSALSSEAVAVARRLGDQRTLLNALICHVAAAMGPDSVEEMAELRREIRELIESTRDSWDEYQLIIVTAFGEDWSLARAEVETYGRLALKLRQPILEWYYGVMNAVLGLLEGRLQDTERVLEAARHHGDRARRWESRFSYRLAIVALRREQDRLGEVVERAHQLAADHPGYRMLPALAAYVDAATGHIDEARRQMDELAVGGFAFLPRDHGWLFGMSYLAETAILLGDAQRAGEIERLLAPYADRMGFASGEVSSGPVDRIRGLLAAFAGRHDEAVVLLENAERDAGQKGARLWAGALERRPSARPRRARWAGRSCSWHGTWSKRRWRHVARWASPQSSARHGPSRRRSIRTRTVPNPRRRPRRPRGRQPSGATATCGRSGAIGSSGFGTARACCTCRG